MYLVMVMQFIYCYLTLRFHNLFFFALKLNIGASYGFLSGVYFEWLYLLLLLFVPTPYARRSRASL